MDSSKYIAILFPENKGKYVPPKGQARNPLKYLVIYKKKVKLHSVPYTYKVNGVPQSES